MTTEPPIPGRTEAPPLDTCHLPPPSSQFPAPSMPDRSGEQPWVGKAKKKAVRKRAR
jgi:hypothetical protein